MVIIPSDFSKATHAIVLGHAGTSNMVLRVAVVDVSSPRDVRLNCSFLPGFTGSAHCTVQYGTDPTYINLPYSAESTETGTTGDTVSVVLGERLNSSTVYYYTVSTVSGDITVTVRGNFTTPLYSKFNDIVVKTRMLTLTTLASLYSLFLDGALESASYWFNISEST